MIERGVEATDGGLHTIDWSGAAALETRTFAANGRAFTPDWSYITLDFGDAWATLVDTRGVVVPPSALQGDETETARGERHDGQARADATPLSARWHADWPQAIVGFSRSSTTYWYQAYVHAMPAWLAANGNALEDVDKSTMPGWDPAWDVPAPEADDHVWFELRDEDRGVGWTNTF